MKKVLIVLMVFVTLCGCSKSEEIVEKIEETEVEEITYEGNLDVDITGTYHQQDIHQLITLEIECYEDGRGQYIETTYHNARNEIREGHFELDGKTLIDQENSIELKLSENEIMFCENDETKKFKKESNLIYRDFLLSNGIYRGMPYVELKGLLGLENDPEPPSGQWNYSSFEYNSMHIGLSSNEKNLKDAIVYDYDLTNPDITTFRGIKIGSSIEEIKEKYGYPSSGELSPYKMYQVGQTQLIFDTMDGKVIKIFCQRYF